MQEKLRRKNRKFKKHRKTKINQEKQSNNEMFNTNFFFFCIVCFLLLFVISIFYILFNLCIPNQLFFLFGYLAFVVSSIFVFLPYLGFSVICPLVLLKSTSHKRLMTVRPKNQPTTRLLELFGRLKVGYKKFSPQ